MSVLKEIKELLNQFASIAPEKAKRFFKTGPNDYAKDEIFAGVPVPQIRQIARRFLNIDFIVLHHLLHSKVNEERLLALIILGLQYEKSNLEKKDKIYNFYCSHLHCINNWNLVDASAHLIIGKHLWEKNRNLLIHLAQSEKWWERRIAMVSTWAFIKKNDFSSTLEIAKILIVDQHDLVHKAAGWMLRECGKRDLTVLRSFLKEHHLQMPRTMLRYAIEKLSAEEKTAFLKVKKR
jgi:3-methyladenine DNA glycosylase AlkD